MAEKKELAVTEEKVVEIEMERLRSFENHPFKVRADSQMIELQESVKKYGILNPLIAVPEGVDAELLMKVLGNPEMAALLTSLARTMKV